MIGENSSSEESIFALISQDVERQGYSVQLRALPEILSNSLFAQQQTIDDDKFKSAGIGRDDGYLKSQLVRTDKICWITGDTVAGKQWLDWTSRLQTYLNHHLFLGLYSFESHFSHFKPGDYYKRHYDCFQGKSNRMISVVTYFNAGWASSNGGELVLYADDQDKDGIRVSPLLGTFVIFLSEEFPHEVLSANRDRYSIAGWFRIWDDTVKNNFKN